MQDQKEIIKNLFYIYFYMVLHVVNIYAYILIFPVYVHTDRQTHRYSIFNDSSHEPCRKKKLTELKYVIKRRARKNCFSLLQDCVIGII